MASIMEHELINILDQFCISGAISTYGCGHINESYLVNDTPKYILQKINTAVFKQPEKVMENIVAVTEHLREKIRKVGGNPDRETLNLIKAKDGKSFYKCDGNNYYRLYQYIEGTVALEAANTPEQFYYAARAFGKFQRLLSDFPVCRLHETIPDFHNTPLRLEALLAAVNEDRCGRAKDVADEIAFVYARCADTAVVIDAINKGRVLLRVTHNDTKLNNVLLDACTMEGVCVIDLDTVMPGSMLYDYGDALRYGANTASEDETDLSKVRFDLTLYESFTRGFLEELLPDLTECEIGLMPFSVKLLTLECGIRFLTDYLNGDTYFKIHRKNHNLDRARTQLRLVADIEQKLDEMKEITEKTTYALMIQKEV
ncbi:MAG: aminoglycoside phosphotransferase family protein [Clostridiales bacterium]|nr:aminoglycoside phosphotransferase family protein [Clostridiales bacterium]